MKVHATALEVSAFARRWWPGMDSDAGAGWYEFSSNGDLVDISPSWYDADEETQRGLTALISEKQMRALPKRNPRRASPSMKTRYSVLMNGGKRRIIEVTATGKMDEFPYHISKVAGARKLKPQHSPSESSSIVAAHARGVRHPVKRASPKRRATRVRKANAYINAALRGTRNPKQQLKLDKFIELRGANTRRVYARFAAAWTPLKDIRSAARYLSQKHGEPISAHKK